jgi:hypothetical protein
MTGKSGAKAARIASSLARVCIRAAAVVAVVMIYGLGLIGAAGFSGLALTAASTSPVQAGPRAYWWGRRGWGRRGWYRR